MFEIRWAGKISEMSRKGEKPSVQFRMFVSFHEISTQNILDFKLSYSDTLQYHNNVYHVSNITKCYCIISGFSEFSHYGFHRETIIHKFSHTLTY